MIKPLPIGSIVRFADAGKTFQILGDPIGEGGASILYPASMVSIEDDGRIVKMEDRRFALKECVPNSSLLFQFRRDENKGIIADDPASEEAILYLNNIKNLQLNEKRTTDVLSDTCYRFILPILFQSDNGEILQQNGHFERVETCFSVMQPLDRQGVSLRDYIKHFHGSIPLNVSLPVMRKVLQAVSAIHRMNYLHLDLQTGNIFLLGDPERDDCAVYVLDFGTAREVINDGLTAAIKDRLLYSSEGFTPPEVYNNNNGTLRLGYTADIYSLGCSFIQLLTKEVPNDRLLFSSDGKQWLRNRHRKLLEEIPETLLGELNALVSKAVRNSPRDRYQNCVEFLDAIAAFESKLEEARKKNRENKAIDVFGWERYDTYSICSDPTLGGCWSEYDETGELSVEFDISGKPMFISTIFEFVTPLDFFEASQSSEGLTLSFAIECDTECIKRVQVEFQVATNEQVIPPRSFKIVKGSNQVRIPLDKMSRDDSEQSLARRVKRVCFVTFGNDIVENQGAFKIRDFKISL